jgi:hypothetical protein
LLKYSKNKFILLIIITLASEIFTNNKERKK